jgi:hypothetical protein
MLRPKIDGELAIFDCLRLVFGVSHQTTPLEVRVLEYAAIVMAGLVPAIHVFSILRKIRGCPAQGRA